MNTWINEYEIEIEVQEIPNDTNTRKIENARRWWPLFHFPGFPRFSHNACRVNYANLR